MAVYYAVVEGDPLDNGGDSHVMEGARHSTIEGPDGCSRGQTHLGQKAWCAVCQSVGVIAAGSGISDYLRGWDGRLNAMEAVGGDIVLCKCEQPPRIMSVYARCCEYMDASTSSTACSFASNALASATLAESQEELEHYFEMVDGKTGAPIEGMTYKLTSNGQSLVRDSTLAGGQTPAFSFNEHPNLTFVAWCQGDVR
ncbi:PAAR domain-containing protein [Trinickia diaoshuihuensis]|uniref:PAAR domain-containing protein n=1 Tax=Trinickia diaoshuihuensis TaxID=2292265 RepID=UPI000E26968C|nr:PAAR domain-containing protein [Trinickia diaoshuihuensis]